ncbi:Ku protein, partial [Streptomyces sp. NPDC059218]
FAWHNRERLGLLRVRDDAIVLHAMRWPDEIRSPDSLKPKDVDLDDEEIERAVQLTDTMALDDISGFRDEYRDALEELIEAKAEGTELPEPAEGEERETGKVVDLMAALNASVKAARESRGEHGGQDATVHTMQPRKKTTPKKKAATARTTTTKTTAGMRTAKKTTTKKAAAGKKRSAS